MPFRIKFQPLGWVTFVVFVSSLVSSSGSERPPHILFVMVDDMGWNDVSYHGSDQIVTPNIDAMAYHSVILQQYYSEPICTPARTALLTGKYPMRLGMQSVPLFNAEDRGIPTAERLLPAYLKELGYSTHLVGKWHVGMSRNEYLAINRGYDTHYGMRGGFVDYYTYDKVETWPDGRIAFGMDLFDDTKPQNHEQRYIVDALTDRAVEIIHTHNTSRPLFLHVTHNAPHSGNAGGALQPPPFTTLRHKHIANSNRRLYADVVSHLDMNIGRLISALDQRRMLHDTIVVFLSDNGAPTEGQFRNWGVNLPFRGIKSTPWEGGVRVPAFIWHSSLRPRVWDGLMHVTDWLPTLMAAAGGEVTRPIDGVNQWEVILRDGESKRKEVLFAVDDIVNYAAYRFGDYKIVIGNMSTVSNDYYGQQLMQMRYRPTKYLSEVLSSDAARAMQTLGFQLDFEEVEAMRKAATIRQVDTVADTQLCVPNLSRGCLFNVRRDPMERHDLWDAGRKIADLLMRRLAVLWRERLPRGPPTIDDRADPVNTGYVWMPWLPDTVSNFVDDNINRNSVNYELIDRLKNVTSTVDCGRQTNIQNLLCLLRRAF